LWRGWKVVDAQGGDPQDALFLDQVLERARLMPNFHDPARPRLGNGVSMYLGPQGPIAALPSVYVRPHPLGGYTLEVFLMVGPNAARGFFHHCEDLEEFFSAYREDPEKVLGERFGYAFDLTQVQGPKKASSLSLEDLGL